MRTKTIRKANNVCFIRLETIIKEYIAFNHKLQHTPNYNGNFYTDGLGAAHFLVNGDACKLNIYRCLCPCNLCEKILEDGALKMMDLLFVLLQLSSLLMHI
jgi:hypothetical protein